MRAYMLNGPRWRTRDWAGVLLVVLASVLLLIHTSCNADTIRPPPPPLIPTYAEASTADADVAWVLAGSPTDGFTPPEPCWPARRCPDFYLAHTVRATAEWVGVDPLLIARLIWVESRADSMALGPEIKVRVRGRLVSTRAVGLGQVVPEIWLGVLPQCGDDLYSVRDNVCYTVHIWRYFRDREHPDMVAAALGYNGCRVGWDCDWYADAVLGDD